jgi:hypothetical protein
LGLVLVLDNRINVTIRELITEAEGCLKMNFLTGASACIRKAIYELLVLEEATGEHYEEYNWPQELGHKLRCSITMGSDMEGQPHDQEAAPV